ncbi:MAG TPA: class I SAM-dependent methyltransferase [Chloroflexia bacterium]
MKNTRRQYNHHRRASPTSWDGVAHWYDNWVGEEGSEHHREVVVPTLLSLLDPQPGEKVLDVGCGQGVLAPYAAKAGARYTGIDASPRLVETARRRHGKEGRFLLGDARELPGVPDLREGSYDAVTFLLSIQDMDPLDSVLASAAWALRPGGRLVALLIHPAFRVPRQSGWGWDEGRKLQYRRVDRYLTPLLVPIKRVDGSRPTSSFHRPVSAYVNGLAACGLVVDSMLEVPAHKVKSPRAGDDRAAEMARREIPLFLGLRARKV